MIRIGIVGDFSEAILAHRAIAAALPLAARELAVELHWEWLHTSDLAAGNYGPLEQFDGFWCTPGSPYADTDAALRAIRFARESGRPYLGTCAGFQHALLEYAHNVWQIPLAAHAELDPEAADPLISRLECSLVEVSEPLELISGSRLAAIYGTAHIVEGYHCNYGLNPSYGARLESGPLAISARDHTGQVRAVELHGHPFYIATLFQPERAALLARTPPLVSAFVKACGAA
jgi:CTP synthase (UTP-ammonia lyase)